MSSTPGINELESAKTESLPKPAKTRIESGTVRPQWLRRFVSEENNQPTFLGHVVISVSLLSLATLSYLGLFVYADTKQTQWLGTTQQLTQVEIDTSIANLKATSSEKNRLIVQAKTVEKEVARHADIMAFFYKQYYISLSAIAGAGLISSICLIFISKHGLEKVNNALINIFIVASTTSVFFINIFFIFKQEENLKGNQELYLSYIALKQELLSYWATGQTITGKQLEPAEFIHLVDKKLIELNQIRLGFDATRAVNFAARFTTQDPTEGGQGGIGSKKP